MSKRKQRMINLGMLQVPNKRAEATHMVLAATRLLVVLVS